MSRPVAPVPFSKEEIENKLKQFPGWEVNENMVEKKFHFRLFKEALEFINKVGEVAEMANHHPDLLLYNYNRVKIASTTHSVGGKITEKDFDLIGRIESIPRKELPPKKA